MNRPEIVYVGDGESSPHVKEAKELIAEDYDKIRADLARFSADTRWVTDNYEALREDYGDMYVAVLDKKSLRQPCGSFGPPRRDRRDGR